MRSSIHRSRLRQTVEINMTPLMDLTFTLLIVFIITVPVLDYSTDVDVSPPELTTSKPVTDINEDIILAMDKDGNCKINDIPLPYASLESRLKELCSAGHTKAYILADKSVVYDEVIKLLRTAKNAGMETSLMTTQEK
jgi:biopolymer transport protein ExbD